MIVDCTLIPYNGWPERRKDEVVKGKSKSGTTWFHAYATANTILSDRRVIAALSLIKSSGRKLDILQGITHLVEGQGIEFKCLYLDRAFFTANTIRHLQARDIQFLMSGMVCGTSYTTHYTMRRPRMKATVAFSIHVVVTYSKGRQGKNKAITYLYVSSSSRPPLVRMQEEYRLKFGIKSSYRLVSRSRTKASTRDSKLQVLYVAQVSCS